MAEALAKKSSQAKSAEQTHKPSRELTRQPAQTSSYGNVLALQRSAGNHAVDHLLGQGLSTLPGTSAAGAVLQRKCACGNDAMASGVCAECSTKKRSGLQTKLKVNEPDDIYEQEADRIADQVMATGADPAVSGAPPRIQRFSEQSKGQMDTAPASVDRVLASPGRPLEAALRYDMGQRFAHDFSRVRVHSGTAAEQSARDVNANAYTVGHNIVFGAGQFVPGTHEGRRLIAHELTHVVQQSGADGARVGQGNEQRRLSCVSQGVDGRVIQRDSNTPASGSAAPTLDQQYNTAVKTAKQTGNWQDAAEKLNGFNREDIQRRLAQLTPEGAGFIHQGALDNPGVGPDSNVAQMTAPGTQSRSNVAAGAGGGRSKPDADNGDDPRAHERTKQKRQQEGR